MTTTQLGAVHKARRCASVGAPDVQVCIGGRHAPFSSAMGLATLLRAVATRDEKLHCGCRQRGGPAGSPTRRVSTGRVRFASGARPVRCSGTVASTCQGEWCAPVRRGLDPQDCQPRDAVHQAAPSRPPRRCPTVVHHHREDPATGTRRTSRELRRPAGHALCPCPFGVQ